MGIYERKQREKERRKEEIISAARKVFSAKGFQRATVEEISSEAELSSGTLYLYFKNKEELHTCLSIDMLKYLASEIKKIESYDISVREKIERYCDIFIDMYDYDANVLINLFHLQSGETLNHLSDEVMQQLKKYSVIAHSSIVTTIKEGIETGICIDEYPEALADILWGAYAGVILWVNSKRLLNEQKDFVKPTLKLAFQIILQGMLVGSNHYISPRMSKREHIA